MIFLFSDKNQFKTKQKIIKKWQIVQFGYKFCWKKLPGLKKNIIIIKK